MGRHRIDCAADFEGEDDRDEAGGVAVIDHSFGGHVLVGDEHQRAAEAHGEDGQWRQRPAEDEEQG